MKIHVKQQIWRKFGLSGAVCLLILIIPALALGQHGNDDDRNELALILGARVNGYTVADRGDGKFLVRILGATNSETGKKLNGKYDFAYRCLNVAKVVIVAVIIAKGMAERELACRIERDPSIYY